MRHRKRAEVSDVVRRVVGDRGRVMRFRDLPREAKYALVQYMGVDGYAWPDVAEQLEVRYHYDSAIEEWVRGDRTGRSVSWTTVLDDVLPYVEAHYGDRLFGYAVVPMSALTSSIMDDPELKEEFPSGSFDEFHARYMGPGGVEEHPVARRWPVILSSEDEHEETLQDGWHRLNDYYRQGARTVPVVYYVD